MRLDSKHFSKIWVTRKLLFCFFQFEGFLEDYGEVFGCSVCWQDSVVATRYL